MRRALPFVAVIVAMCSNMPVGTAQVGASPQAAGPGSRDAAIATSERVAGLLGKAGFTAVAIMTSVDKNGDGAVTEVAYAMHDGMVRSDLDLAKTKVIQKGKSAPIDAEKIEILNTVGMAKSVTVVRPDRKVTYFIRPGFKGYVELPHAVADGKKLPTSQWKAEGKDKIDDHPCTKYVVTTTNPDGGTETATVWKATDLDEFVIQTVFLSGEHTTTFKFTNIKMEKPDPAQFDVPPDYKKYASMQGMVTAVFQGATQGAVK